MPLTPSAQGRTVHCWWADQSRWNYSYWLHGYPLRSHRYCTSLCTNSQWGWGGTQGLGGAVLGASACGWVQRMLGEPRGGEVVPRGGLVAGIG